ncbi:MAG: hypothetical protein PHS59_11305 [Paludibacter sp.]|nr:hypothetical protein [Paludibacter sp.]
MKTKITFLIATLAISLHLFAITGKVTIPIASGASVSTIQTAMSDAVTAGNTDITLEFANEGVYGTSASSDITIAVPAGVTKLTFYAPSSVTTKPVLYINTLTYADALMTGGITFDGIKLETSPTSSRYLVQPTSSSVSRIPASLTVKNCWIEGYRAVLYSSIATTTSEVIFINNIFKNIAASGIISVSAGFIPVIKIRNNTFINVGGTASGGSDYFIDFRSANSVTSQINFSNNTIYYPTLQTRGLFRLSGQFTTGYIKENNNLYSNGNPTTYSLSLLYTNVTAATTDVDSTNYYSNKFSGLNNTGTINTTVYTENSPSNLFFNAAADDFTINDPNFAGKSTAGDPRWFPQEVTAPVTLSTSVSPANAGTVTPASATVNSGTGLSLSATNNFGFTFKEWRDGTSNDLITTDNPYTFTISANTSLVAVYDALTTYDFTTNVTGSLWGTVTLTPAPTNGKYVAGTVVSMAAVNDSVSTFVNWTDASTEAVRSITVDANKDFTATFTDKSFIVGWDLVTPESKNLRPGDYYSNEGNKGIFSAYEPTGSAVNWLTYTASGTPCGLLWTSNTTTRRYFQATFSTLGYENIKVHSNMFAYNQFFYPGQKLQYSTNGTDFSELASTTLVASTWVYFPANLPQSLENKTTVYLRWIADETTTAVGSGNDGTGISNIYIFADEIATANIEKPTNEISGYKSENRLVLNNIPANSTISVYSVSGKLLKQELNSSSTYSTTVNCSCIVRVVNNNKVQNLKFL